MVKEEYIEKNIVEGIFYLKTERAFLNTFNDSEVSSMISCYGKNKDFTSQRN